MTLVIFITLICVQGKNHKQKWQRVRFWAGSSLPLSPSLSFSLSSQHHSSHNPPPPTIHHHHHTKLAYHYDPPSHRWKPTTTMSLKPHPTTHVTMTHTYHRQKKEIIYPCRLNLDGRGGLKYWAFSNCLGQG